MKRLHFLTLIGFMIISAAVFAQGGTTVVAKRSPVLSSPAPEPQSAPVKIQKEKLTTSKTEPVSQPTENKSSKATVTKKKTVQSKSKK